MRPLEYHRPPTPGEIKFCEGATHILDVDLKDIMFQDAIKKNCMIKRKFYFRGLLYFRYSWTGQIEEVIPVVFRKDKRDGSIMALFPNAENSRDGRIFGYEHNGQYFEAWYRDIITTSSPCYSQNEYLDLFNEINAHDAYKNDVFKIFIRKQPKF